MCLKQLKKEKKKAGVIIFSATTLGDKLEGLDFGADD